MHSRLVAFGGSDAANVPGVAEATDGAALVTVGATVIGLPPD